MKYADNLFARRDPVRPPRPRRPIRRPRLAAPAARQPRRPQRPPSPEPHVARAEGPGGSKLIVGPTSS